MHEVVRPDQAQRRPEFVRQTVPDTGFGVVEKPLTLWEQIYNQSWLRKILILVVLAILWESYASCMNAVQFAGTWKIPTAWMASLPEVIGWPVAATVGLINWITWFAEVVVSLPQMTYKAWGVVSAGQCQENPLLFPKFSAAMVALWEAALAGELLGKVVNSVRLLLQGYATGLFLATVLTTLAILTTIGNDFLETLTAMFNPLPAIALLPLALIWFGLGDKSIIFVLVHSVLWAVALNTHSGFKSVSNTLRMVGRNYGLSGIRYVSRILIPAAFPSILTGLKIGWAFAWRTLIAAELVFGAQSGKGGLGWFIYEAKNQLEIPTVFAGLVSVIIIGLLVENLIFRKLEAATVRKWGMQT